MPLSILYSRPAVGEVTLIVPVGVEQVGSVAVAVTTGAPGAVPTVTGAEASQPAAFFTHTVWLPVAMPVKVPAYGA